MNTVCNSKYGILALLALLCASSVTQAQNAVELVENTVVSISNTTSGLSSYIASRQVTNVQPFTTGPNNTGYFVKNIEIWMKRSGDIDDSTINATIRPFDNINNLSDEITATLTKSGDLTTDWAEYTWSAPDETLLSPDTTYALVIDHTEASSTKNIAVGSRGNIVDSSSYGWSVGNNNFQFHNGIQFSLNLTPIALTVNGIELPAATTDLEVALSCADPVLTWSAVANATKYKVEWRDENQSWSDAVNDNQTVTITGTSYTINNLSSGIGYVVRVLSGNDDDLFSPPPPPNSQGSGNQLNFSLTPCIDANWANYPETHGGANATFTVDIKLSDWVIGSFRHMRDTTVTASGGTVVAARRVVRRSVRVAGRLRTATKQWRITVKPNDTGSDPVVLTLQGTSDCNRQGAVCTPDGARVGDSMELTIPADGHAADAPDPTCGYEPQASLPELCVSDATANESDGSIVFHVRLTKPVYRHTAVWVDFRTESGTAKGNVDYWTLDDTLDFGVGRTQLLVAVPLIADFVNDDGETFELILSNARLLNLETSPPTKIADLRIRDARGTGTIENAGVMPQAWIGRFGRTVGSQAVEAIRSRQNGDGSQIMVGGQPLPLTGEASEMSPEQSTQLEAQLPTPPRGDSWGVWEEPDEEHALSRAMSGSEFLLGSSFQLNTSGEDARAVWTSWGRFATSSFDGNVDGLGLDGNVNSGFLGVDLTRGQWLGGLAFSISSGRGSYEQEASATSELHRDKGQISSRLRTVWPYMRYSVSERLDLWAIVGIGRGSLTLSQEGASPLTTDLSLRMGAVGAEGGLLPVASALSLRMGAEAMWVQTKSAGLQSSEGNLAAAQADVTRLRLTLTGERPMVLADGARLVPSLEIGVRHDGGDAERGAGLDIAGRLSYEKDRLRLVGAVRTLVMHEVSSYQEWEASGELQILAEQSGRGLSLSLRQSWGLSSAGTDRFAASAFGGVPGEKNWSTGKSRRLDAEVGYGIGLAGDRLLGRPVFAIGVTETGREIRSGWQLRPISVERQHFQLTLAGVRSRGVGDVRPQHRIGLTLGVVW